MIKNNKRLLIITSLVILLPICVGCILWDSLPDMMATHWGVGNEPNGYSSKAMAVFGIPLIMLAMQWFLVLLLGLDIKKKNLSAQMFRLALWIIPLMTVLMCVVTYAYGLGVKLDIGFWVLIVLGILFVVLGNYLPKCRQNWVVGIKLPWTLSDADNWYHTHRMAGPIWVIGGLFVILGSFFSSYPVAAYGIIVVILLMILIPTVYSYLYYNKHSKEE